MTDRKIPVYSPVFTEDDAHAAAECVRSGVLSWFGPEVQRLEERFASISRRKFALACASGTSGLHLALSAVVRPGELVAVPTLAYAPVAFAPLHAGARVAFVDADPATWNLDLDGLEAISRTRPVKAAVAVHTYGNPVDMDRLKALSEKHGFRVVEDACEALSGSWKGTALGGLGHVGVYSFYGNKIVSSGEGGMVVTDDPSLYDTMATLRGQGEQPGRKYWHTVAGWNSRMTNLQAAVLNTQLDRFDRICAAKNRVRECYRELLHPSLIWQETPPGGVHAWWMVAVRHHGPGWGSETAGRLARRGIDTRPVFPPLHGMPPCRHDLELPHAGMVHDTGVVLPGGPGLTQEDIGYVAAAVNEGI
jgi:perosamine synthetase